MNSCIYVAPPAGFEHCYQCGGEGYDGIEEGTNCRYTCYLCMETGLLPEGSEDRMRAEAAAAPVEARELTEWELEADVEEAYYRELEEKEQPYVAADDMDLDEESPF